MDEIAIETEDAAALGCVHWATVGRGGLPVSLRWHWRDDGEQVHGTVAIGGQPELEFELAYLSGQLRWAGPPWPFEVVLWLVRKDGRHGEPGLSCLKCALPLSDSEYVSRTIGSHWIGPGERWSADAPAPSEIDISSPQASADLLPFVWLHPPGRRARQRQALRYIIRPELGIAQPQLPAPMAAFQALRGRLLQIEGALALEFLRAEVELVLGQSLAHFLEHNFGLGEETRVWTTLIALAQVRKPADPALATESVDELRVVHFLRLLLAETGALCDQAARHEALHATPVLPDSVALHPPHPGIGGPTPSSTDGRWEVLGVGSLRMARQRLSGYAAGELADVVNVMPRERQEVSERSVTLTTESSASAQEQSSAEGSQRATSAFNDLADAMEAVMAAGGKLMDMTKVKPAYDNMNMMLSGAASEGEADSRWAARETAHLAQRMTEQAARHLGQRACSERGRVWQELKERRQSNLIDNLDNGRLVGLYRWVDRLMQVHMDELGQRLILSFMVAKPASTFLDRIAAQGAVPLVKPAPLDAFTVAQGQGYKAISADNYQSYGARYGLADLAPPPSSTLMLAVSIDPTSPGGEGLRIPDGYVATAGTVTMGVSDNRYNIVCALAGQLVVPRPAEAPGTAPVLDVSVPVPVMPSASPALPGGPAAGDAAVTVPAAPVAAIYTSVLDAVLPALAGDVAVTVLTAAPQYRVRVELVCQEKDSAAPDLAFSQWQLATYRRLLEAYQDCWTSYHATVAARIAAASDGRPGQTQRGVLKQRCLQLLTPKAHDQPQDFHAVEQLIDWAGMTWQYEPWKVDESSAWPELEESGSLEPGSERLFAQFLQAPSARVLVPVTPGHEAWLLFLLQFGQGWAGGPDSVPVTAACMALLDQVAEPAPAQAARQPGWQVRIPTSMLYLQGDEQLPHFQCPGDPGREQPA